MIELLSPTKKLPGRGRDSYLAKQASYFQARINLVEIDLTREGDRTAIMPWQRNVPPPHPAYLAGVHRLHGLKQSKLEYYLLPLELPLKPLRIPLRPADEDVVLRLQPLVDAAYERGRYALLDYSAKLTPPLSFAEQSFLAQRLAERT